MTKKQIRSTATAWAHFRFSVVGALLSAPPARGELRTAIQQLADKSWTHPVHGQQVKFAAATIERWYYTARRERDDPVGVLQRAVRKDAGRVTLPAKLADHLRAQYRQHPHWSYQLHYDNLAARAKDDPALGSLVSYSTLRRYMQAHGLVRKPRPRPKSRPAEMVAERRHQQREVRGYEAEYVGSLWHLDFHHGSLKVLTHDGQWRRPIALGILDDHSRLCCHLQWYLSETTEDLVHGFSQAIQKRGLPRALLTDNGSAMIAEEFTQGLLRLGICHHTTLPYSPYQNGKQESFWGHLEGRLMEMLEGVVELTLDFLNEATQAWYEIEYHRTSASVASPLPSIDTSLSPTSQPSMPPPSSPASMPSLKTSTESIGPMPSQEPSIIPPSDVVSETSITPPPVSSELSTSPAPTSGSLTFSAESLPGLLSSDAPIVSGGGGGGGSGDGGGGGQPPWPDPSALSMSPIPTSESPLPELSLPSMESLSETVPPMSLPDTSETSIEPPPPLPTTKSETPL